MTKLTPQQQIDTDAEVLRIMLAPHFYSQQKLIDMIEWVKHNAKACQALTEGKPTECLIELYQAYLIQRKQNDGCQIPHQ